MSNFKSWTYRTLMNAHFTINCHTKILYFFVKDDIFFIQRISMYMYNSKILNYLKKIRAVIIIK